MKIYFSLFIFFVSIIAGNSQILSEQYNGNYRFIYRTIDSTLNKSAIISNNISKVEIKDSLYYNHLFIYVQYYNSNGEIIKIKRKRTSLKSKVFYLFHRILHPFRNKKKLSVISAYGKAYGPIDSIQYNGTTERYYYNQTGYLINIKIDQNVGIKDCPQLKEVKLDYDSTNNLILEKVYWWAGDNSIVNHEYMGKRIIRSTYINDTRWNNRIVDKSQKEIIEYKYLGNGLLDSINIKNKNDHTIRWIKFKYE